jgi:hypothetical protein
MTQVVYGYHRLSIAEPPARKKGTLELLNSICVILHKNGEKLQFVADLFNFKSNRYFFK